MASLTKMFFQDLQLVLLDDAPPTPPPTHNYMGGRYICNYAFQPIFSETELLIQNIDEDAEPFAMFMNRVQDMGFIM